MRLRFTKEPGNLDLKNPEMFIAQNDLREAATSAEVEDLLLRDPTVLKQPLLEHYKGQCEEKEGHNELVLDTPEVVSVQGPR